MIITAKRRCVDISINMKTPIKLVDQYTVEANKPYIEEARSIFVTLDIGKKAFGIFDPLVFLIRNGMDAEKFLLDFMIDNAGAIVFSNVYDDKKRKLYYKTQISINFRAALKLERKRLIDRTRFASLEEFLIAYEDPQSALERMFGEEIWEPHIRYVPEDIMALYLWHVDNPYGRLGAFYRNYEQ